MGKVVAVAVSVALCASVVRRGTPELALLLALAAGAWMLCSVADSLALAAALMDRLAQVAHLDEQVIAPVFKTVALSILTRISAELCRCAGESGLAAFVETAGTVLAVGASLPLASGVLAMLEGILW